MNNIYDDRAVEQRIKLMEETFHLVMILENFEGSLRTPLTDIYHFTYLQESLILMKDLLCWEDEDITNLKLNGRKTSVVILYLTICLKAVS